MFYLPQQQVLFAPCRLCGVSSLKSVCASWGHTGPSGWGSMDAPLGTREFQCGGQESALLDWRSSEEHLLTGQSCWTHLHLYKRICVTPDLLDSHCALLTTFWFLSRSCQVGGRSQSLCRNTGGETGRLETSSGHYRTLKEVAALCRGLDCGCSAVSAR